MKDYISNIIALILVIVTPVEAYLQAVGDGPIDWIQLGLMVAGAVIAYFTGKSQDLRSKA